MERLGDGLPAQVFVPAAQCQTCIYHEDSLLDLAKLERQVADDRMAGHFKGYRVCHGYEGTKHVCRGFWDRHRENCTPLQIATRLGLVEVEG